MVPLMDPLESLTVSSSFLRYLTESAQELGCDLNPTLKAMGIEPEQLHEPSLRVPLKIEQALLEQAMSQSQDPFFGCIWGS